MNRILVAFIAACALSANAQTYPTKPVQVIISFTPASATDIVGRIVTAKLSEYWGQPVVNENRSGAGGSIGSAAVAKAAPDGYTLLINSNAHSVNPAIYAKLPYETTKDFTDIAPLSELPNVLVVSAESRYKTLAELVGFGKANPGRINFGHAGVGSGTHLNTVKLVTAAGIDVTQVPFKGTPEVVAAILSGNVDCYWVPISAGIANIKAGKLRALAVSTAKRSALLPDLATTAEGGVKGADFGLWFGMWGPAGMSAELTAKINADVRKALADSGVREKLANTGNSPLDMSPQEFARFVRSEIDDYQRVVRAAGIKPQ
ncbi:MAG TPA: tripartite tricarboxylate transporter substrate binding protein [Burkholderiales bacterium]|jgi:tripartite-type tricarboxylate transporter receptor subunit TctC|nr:tripartite tricarboxylate transporter substrate binding protein [Burkholderiales bacterium]HSA68054.1 tripartite tricarboxylate transporter substrate binding protein [Burkholderiales bacterium]